MVVPYLGSPSSRIAQFIKRRTLPYDAEVGYLQSSGTQVIDCAVSPSSSWRIETKAQFVAAVSGDQGLFGNYVAGTLGSLVARTGSYWYMWHGSGTGWTGIAPASSDVWYDVVASDSRTSGRTFAIDGTSYSKSGNTAYLANGNRYVLFAAGMNYAKTSIRIAPTKIYIDGVLARDFIPVRFTNGLGQSEGAMYDRSGTGGMNPDGSPRTDGLYRNRGTGAFTWAKKT